MRAALQQSPVTSSQQCLYPSTPTTRHLTRQPPGPPAAERRWSETCWLGVQNFHFAHFYWLTSDSLFFLPVVACNALLVSCVCTVHLRALISVCVGEMEHLRTCLRVTATVKGGGDASGPPAPKQARPRYFRQSRHRCFYQDQRWQG